MSLCGSTKFKMAARMLCSRSKSKHIRILGRFITSAALNPSRNALLTPCTHRLLSSVNYKILSKKCYLSSVVSKNFVRSMSNESSQKKKDSSIFNELMEAKEQPQSQLTVGAKVVQAGRDVTYFGIILVGFAVTGALIWYVVSELFLGFSPNTVYSYALKQVLANSEVVDELEEPIMGHGETTRRGRRRHVSYQEYIVDGENYMRVKFYVKGQRRTGTVHVDVKQGSRGSITYRFILVELDDYPQRSIIVLDNR